MNRAEWWDSFNEDLYMNYLIQKDEQMNKYKIIYKEYLGGDTSAPCIKSVKYVNAESREDAIRVLDRWRGLIISIQKL